MSRKLVDGKMPTIPATANKGGKPPELTDDMIQKICKPLLIGLPVTTSVALQKISYATLRLWVLKGHKEPDSIYGTLLAEIQKSIAEWETRDLSVIESHAHGRPAQYEMEVVRDKDGSVVKGPDGKPLMQVARNSKGDPILKSAEIKSDWKAAMERLSRRMPRTWRQRLLIDVEKKDVDSVLTFTNEEREVKPIEAKSFDEQVSDAMKSLEEGF